MQVQAFFKKAATKAPAPAKKGKSAPAKVSRVSPLSIVSIAAFSREHYVDLDVLERLGDEWAGALGAWGSCKGGGAQVVVCSRSRRDLHHLPSPPQRPRCPLAHDHRAQ